MTTTRAKAFFSDGCTYDAANEQLTVEFTVYRKRVNPQTPSGRPYKYIYDEVPISISEAFLNDNENGEFYNSDIRSEYDFTRIS